MEVNGDMMSKNPRVMCLGSARKEKRHELAEKEPGRQRVNKSYLGKVDQWDWSWKLAHLMKKCAVGRREKRKKDSGKPQVIQRGPCIRTF